MKNNTYKLTTDDQIIASTLWELAAMCICPHCKSCIRDCQMAVADGEWDTDAPLECGCECNKRYLQRVTQLHNALLASNALVAAAFPVYAKKLRFSNELYQVLYMLRAWDPNGDWDVWDILATPLQTMEVIEDAMAELAADYQDVPGWMSVAIDLLMLFC